MRKLDNADNAIVWLDKGEQDHPREIIARFISRFDLGKCRFLLWQMLKWYGRAIDKDESLTDASECLYYFEQLVCLLEANYIIYNKRNEVQQEDAETGGIPVHTVLSLTLPDDIEGTDPIARIIYMITQSMDAEKIFLLGTYPLLPQEPGIEYDLLVLLKDAGNRPLGEYESLINNRSHDMAPVTVSVYKLSKVNALITGGNYFFSSVCQPASLVYDAGREEMTKPVVDYQQVKHKNLKENFPLWIEKANSFLTGAVHYHGMKEFSLAAFMLHQAVEHGLNALLVPLMQFKTQTHNLHKLMRMVRRFNMELFSLFPRNTEIEVAIFSKLQKAYIHGRYKDNFILTEEEVELLMDRVMLLLQKVNEEYKRLISP